MTEKGVIDIRFNLLGLIHAALWLATAAGGFILLLVGEPFVDRAYWPALLALSAACLVVARFFLRHSVIAVRHSMAGWIELRTR